MKFPFVVSSIFIFKMMIYSTKKSSLIKIHFIIITTKMSSTKFKKWSSKKGAGLILRAEILRNGYLKGEKPKASDIWKSNPVYQDYDPNKFRTNFNRMYNAMKEERDAEKRLGDLHEMNGKKMFFLFLEFLFFNYDQY